MKTYCRSAMKCINRYLIPWASVAALLLASAAHAQSVHISHCQGACPAISDPDNELVLWHLYAASIDRRSGLAEWVAYRVVEGSVGVASLLPRLWRSDALLRNSPGLDPGDNEGPRIIQPDLSNAQDREYRVNEVLINPEDRGRLAPMTSFSATPYWQELNNLSNMAPLSPALRLGSWARLEQAINEAVAHQNELYVVSGPLPEQPGSPSAFFKVVRSATAEAAFIFPQTLAIHADYCAQLSSRQFIERRLGLTLFPSLDSSRDNGDSAGLAPVLGCRDAP